MTFGARLRAARKARGWSIMRLAASSGVNADTISGIESERRRGAHVSTAEALAVGLGVPVCALVGTSCDTGTLYARAADLEVAAHALRDVAERMAKSR